jgi:ribosomal protein L16 Arg81 hydroxylase
LRTDYTQRHAVFHHPNPNAAAVDVDPWLAELTHLDNFLETYFDTFARDEVASLKSANSTAVPWASVSASSWHDLRGRFLSEGMSLVVRREKMDEMPPSPLEQALEAVFNSAPSTTHAYISAPNAKALEAHTDPYDVFVLQVRQRK